MFICRGKDKRDGEIIVGNLNIVNDKKYINGLNGDLDDIDYGWGFVEIKPLSLEISCDGGDTWRSFDDIQTALSLFDSMNSLGG